MSDFQQPRCAFRPALEEEAGLITYLRLASLICLEMPGHSLDAVRALMGALPDVDARLIRSGKYFVADCGGELIAGAGWSVLPLNFRGERLVGKGNEPADFEVGHNAVLLRGFFLDPDAGRRGAGASLLAHVEADIMRAGFVAGEILAPAASQVFYKGLGFRPLRSIALALDSRDPLALIHMRKSPALRLALAA